VRPYSNGGWDKRTTVQPACDNLRKFHDVRTSADEGLLSSNTTRPTKRTSIEVPS